MPQVKTARRRAAAIEPAAHEISTNGNCMRWPWNVDARHTYRQNERGSLTWLAWWLLVLVLAVGIVIVWRDTAGAPSLLHIYLIAGQLLAVGLALRWAQLAQRWHGAWMQAQSQGLALQASVDQYRGLIEVQTDLISLALPDGQLIYVNPAYARQFACAPHELLGRNLLELVDPAEREQFALGLRGLHYPGGALTIESRAVVANAATKWLAWTHQAIAAVANPAGVPAHAPWLIHSVGRDVSERRRTQDALDRHEQQLAGIIDSAMDAIVTINAQRTVVVYNRAAAEMFGIPIAQALGSDLDRFIPERHREIHKRDIAAYASFGDTRRRMGQLQELTALRADGTEFPIEVSIAKVGEGDQVLMTAVVRDLTERRGVELARQALIAADAANRAKTEFLSRMSHEIRTPLNAVLGFAQIGLRDSASPQSDEAFGRIMKAGTQLLGVINDVLDFSKIEAGKLSIEARAFQLNTMVHAVVDLVTERARAKSLHLAVHLSSDLPSWVQGDPLRLQQVLSNLLSNAVKFTDHGQVVLSVRPEEGMICFRVTDQGIGMRADQLERLFRPFEQADTSITRRYGGTGLGLAISADLAKLMGGRITADSRPGLGSCFTLSVPLPIALAVEHLEVASDPAGPRLKGLRVLAADDVEVNLLVLDSMLTHEGANVVWAYDGARALELLEEVGVLGFDVALLDVQMPVMDGIEAARRMRAIAPGLPLIGLTAHAMAQERDKCLAAGMSRHVTKPVIAEELIAAVLEVTRQEPSASRVPAAPVSAVAKYAVPERDAPVIDWDELQATFGNKPGVIGKMIESVLRHHAQSPQRLRVAARERNLAQLALDAHALKGMAGNLKAWPVFRLAAATERVAKEGGDEATGLALELAVAFEDALSELSRRMVTS